MIIDGRTLPSGSIVTADLCIIGGGPAGISLALQFASQAGVNVALIESGGREWDPRTQDLSAAEAKGHPYFPVKETHLRVLGGSTWSYGGICTELTDLDFEKRSWVPESGWPVERAELDRHRDDAHKLLGVEDTDTRARHWESTKATYWEEALVSRPPLRFGREYAADLENASNVTTYLHSTVTNLDLHPDGKHLQGADIRCIGGNQYRVTAKYFVLAGGGIEIPRLMLASNGVATSGIGNSHDNVGRYFQEHLRAIDRYAVPEGEKGLTDQITGASGTLRFSRLALTEETLREEGLLNYLANLTFGFSGQDTEQWQAVRRVVAAVKPPWRDSPYFQSIGGGLNKIHWSDVKTSMVRPHRTIQSVIGAGFRPRFMRKWVEVGSSIEQVPRRDNRIVLAPNKDELGMPRAELRWSLDELERVTYYRGRELVLEELERHLPGLSRQRLDDPEQWPDHIFGTWHHAGTTRMHIDPKQGVVDANAKVHGIDNMYIVSSSIFPTSGATAPTQSIVLFALRLAAHLRPLLSA